MTRQDPESDSEASDGQSSPGSARFRVRVNMERFFDDERARAYVCVRARRRVRWLQRRLAARFRLPPRLLLLSRGHLLPPAEPLAVLCPDDPVDVLPGAPLDGLDTAEPPPRDDEDELGARKMRALRMLEQYCGDRIEPQSVERSAAQSRRRRVRRRRRPAPYCAVAEASDLAPTAEHDHGLAPTAEHDHGLAPIAERDWGEPAPTAGRDSLQVSSDLLQATSVLRNDLQKTRIPRVIRALGDEV